MATLIAHRGSSIEAPENTLSSIQKAIDHGVDYIEIDIRLSKDLIPIVFHDPTTGRTTNCSRNVPIEELTLQEIQMLDAGIWFHDKFKGESIPTLDQVLQLDFKSSHLLLEIKSGKYPYELIADKVLQSLFKTNNKHLIEHSLIGSFEPGIIEFILNNFPRFKIKGIIENPTMMTPFLRMNIDHLSFHHKIITPHLVKELHDQKTKVWAYTVDDKRICQALLSIGVDGIITNDPKNIGPILKNLSVPRKLGQKIR